MSNERYVLVVSGERFNFTKEQLLSDPDSYFTTVFFGDFAESANDTRELVIEKEPMLFRIIQAHLRGYEILPLPIAAIPSYMSPEVALVNLYREAQYYGLQQLQEKLEDYNPDLKVSAVDSSKRSARQTKTYKFAKLLGTRGWIINDTTPEAYQLLLKRAVAPGSNLKVVVGGLECPGFKQIITWNDSSSLDSGFALLESE